MFDSGILFVSTALLRKSLKDNYWNQFRKAEVQELNNGRLAMMAIVGLIVQDSTKGARACEHFTQNESA